MRDHIKNLFICIFIGAALLSMQVAVAAPLTVPNMFTAGSAAVAAEVNGNFNAVQTAVNDNDARVAALEAANEQLQAQLNLLSGFINELQTYVSVGVDGQGQPSIFFSGANVHINNGASWSAINGLGNLVVGYDGVRADTVEPHCSVNAHDNQMDCEAALGGVWAVNHKTGSHNIVLGMEHNYSSREGLLAGFRNSTTAQSASVTGGSGNLAGRFNASILGGTSNVASGPSSTVSGGYLNVAATTGSSVSGGRDNGASGSYATVSGGYQRSASTLFSWTAGSLQENN